MTAGMYTDRMACRSDSLSIRYSNLTIWAPQLVNPVSMLNRQDVSLTRHLLIHLAKRQR